MDLKKSLCNRFNRCNCGEVAIGDITDVYSKYIGSLLVAVVLLFGDYMFLSQGTPLIYDKSLLNWSIGCYYIISFLISILIFVILYTLVCVCIIGIIHDAWNKIKHVKVVKCKKDEVIK